MVIELDFVAADAPELWHRTGAGASEQQSLHDLYPGRLRLRVNGTDLSPKALVPLLATAAPMNQFLAAVPPPKAASWAPSDQLPRHAYRIERIPSGRVHVSASWSGSGTTWVEAALRAAWGCFTRRVLGELAARDPSVAHNVVVRHMMPAVRANQPSRSDAACRPIVLGGVETRSDRRSLAAAADTVARVAWGHGGFTEIGANPTTVRVGTGTTARHRPWTGETDPAGHPVTSCVVADRIDQRSVTQVVRDAVLTALRAWGCLKTLRCSMDCALPVHRPVSVLHPAAQPQLRRAHQADTQDAY
jgi:hypothetical protein